MLNVSENELLTRTGLGTPMGDLFRRFWHPVLLTEELPENSPEVAPARYRLPDGAIIDICRDVRNADNDYLIDRAMQRTQNFTGIRVVRSQDTAMTESMGGVVDRSQEHLGTTDVAVIAARRRLIAMARDLQDGVEPTETLRPESYNVRAVDLVCPEDDFSHFMDLYADEALGKV